MGFLDRLVAGAEYRSAEYRAGPTSTLAAPSRFLTDAFGSSRASSGQRVTVDKAIGLAPVFSAVSIVAETLGELPLKVYRDIGDGAKLEATDHRAYRMLHFMPNPVTPANRFWSTVTAHLLLWGNAYIEKVRSDMSGLVEELWLLDPATVQVEWDRGSRTKRFVQDESGRHRKVWSTDEVLHISGLSMNGIVGDSVISNCRNTFGTAMARDQFEGGFYDHGAMLRGVIEHPQRIGADAIKNLRESFTGIYGGSAKAHQTAVLEEDAKFRSLTMPMADLEFMQAQQLTRTDVAILFKLPPAYLGGSSGGSLTYATVESNQIQFAQNAISPWATTIAKAVGADAGIFPFQSWYPEFVMEGLMRGDTGSRGTWYKDLASVRAITPNEIRERENMPPLPDGDTVGPPVQERISETGSVLPDGSVAPTPAPANALPPPPANGKVAPTPTVSR